jgi:hypothetical protein
MFLIKAARKLKPPLFVLYTSVTLEIRQQKGEHAPACSALQGERVLPTLAISDVPPAISNDRQKQRLQFVSGPQMLRANQTLKYSKLPLHLGFRHTVTLISPPPRLLVRKFHAVNIFVRRFTSIGET